MKGPTIGTRLALAQASADAARARLAGTITELQHRASPNVIAHDVAESLKERGMEALTGAVDTAKRRPVPVGIGLTVFGLFLARGPIANAIRHATSAKPKS
uniref:DUF3618 domain-containing protein n=1 Tax=uncultured Sphingomonas sp. TaxID=158754 RepID=UPI0035CA960C